jgi:hypothetical protein
MKLKFVIPGLLAFVLCSLTLRAQTITNVTPEFGQVGDIVVITGSGFVPNATTVRFNGVIAPIAPVTSTQPPTITAKVPAGATTGLISVTTAAGTGFSPQPFIVIGAGPYIHFFSPTSGGPSTDVTLEGAHFTGATKVEFNGVSAAFSPPTTDARLVATAPAGVATGPIKVTTSKGTFTTSSNFFGPPSITSFGPASGRVGTNVILTGKNLSGLLGIKFNGVNATSVSNISATSASAVVPLGATTGKISVQTRGGLFFTTTNFVVAPTIRSFSPSAGAGGTVVTVLGYNFEGLLQVKIGGLNALVSQATSTSAVATVAATAVSGAVQVVTTNGAATSTNLFYLPPSISTVVPGAGATGASITINGANFTNASAVRFGGVSSTFTVPANNRIQATVPPGALTGQITVVTPGGQATSSSIFFAPPTITGFNPGNGLEGTNVTITGTNFTGATQVRFNGTVGTIVNINNNNQLVARVPAGATTGQISVTVPAGTAQSTGSFSVNPLSNIGVSIAATNTVQAQSPVQFHMIVTNLGPAGATVTVTNFLPANVRFETLSSSQGNLSRNGSLIFGSLGTIGAGGFATIDLSVTPLAAGRITNTVAVSTPNVDSDSANDQAGAVVTVSPYAFLQLQRAGTTNVTISWSASLDGFNLQSTTNLTGSSWSAVEIAPVIIGDEKVVTNRIDSRQRYYRLQK